MTADPGSLSTAATRKLLLLTGNTAAAPESPPEAMKARRSRSGKLTIPAILLGTDLGAFAAAIALTAHPTAKTFAVLVVILILFQTAGLYRPRLNLSVLDDAPAIIGRALAAGAAAMVIGGLDDGVVGTRRLATCAVFGALAIPGRIVGYEVIRFARRRRLLQQRTLILGAGAVAATLAGNLAEHPEYGLRLEGMIDDDPLLSEEERPVPLLGRYEDLAKAVVERSVDIVIVTFGSFREPSVVSLLRTCDRLACEILFVPRLYELHSVTKDTEVLWGLPLVRLRRAPFRSGAWSGKRVGDVLMAGTLLLLVAPILLLCGLLARWETGCFVFRQTRVGMDGRPFTLLKFCSLRPEVESEAVTRWNIGTDGRVGPVGKVLRRTSLDELPQLWNVLRGDMSMVGPRPERPFFVDEFTRQFPWYTARHRVPVGLTGWAQIHGLRGDTSVADRARFDNFYIENWSLWGDVKILLRTAAQVLKAGGR